MKICMSIQRRDPSFDEMERELSKYAEVDVVGLDGYTLEGYDVFIGKKLAKETLDTADRLMAIFAYKTGVDDFPLDELDKRGIKLFNSHIDSKYIAEYAFGLSISLVNRITEFDKKMRKDTWYDNKHPFWRSFFEMKVGLLGYGHIGKAIHGILKRNDVETYTIDRGHEYEDINLVKDLDELCKSTDIIIISLPKTGETDDLFDSSRFADTEKKFQYLVNVGRSNCIDQGALYEALRFNQITGAAIDTWDNKPKDFYSTLNPSEYDFKSLDNIVLSPHQAMRVKVGHDRYVKDTTEKVKLFINGEMPSDMVDLKRGY